MKTTFYLTASILGLMLLSHNSYAADNIDLAQSGEGEDVTIAITVSGAPTPFTFTPSTNVNIDGKTGSTSFQMNAWHTQAVGKNSGQRYGMASDSNKMYFIDLSQTASVSDLTGTTSGAFAGWTTL